jgi:flagellar biogenesis protein FliO
MLSGKLAKYNPIPIKVMTVSNHPHSSGLAALILLVGAVIWSMMRVFSSIVFSIVSYVLTIYDACQMLAVRKTAQEIEVMYNLANYPDEISIALK